MTRKCPNLTLKKAENSNMFKFVTRNSKENYGGKFWSGCLRIQFIMSFSLLSDSLFH